MAYYSKNRTERLAEAFADLTFSEMYALVTDLQSSVSDCAAIHETPLGPEISVDKTDLALTFSEWAERTIREMEAKQVEQK